MKKQQRTELSNEITYIDNKIEERKKDLKSKMTAQERLEEELDKTQRVIEMIYYFGS